MRQVQGANGPKRPPTKEEDWLLNCYVQYHLLLVTSNGGHLDKKGDEATKRVGDVSGFFSACRFLSWSVQKS